jgi:hypothetical protein
VHAHGEFGFGQILWGVGMGDALGLVAQSLAASYTRGDLGACVAAVPKAAVGASAVAGTRAATGAMAAAGAKAAADTLTAVGASARVRLRCPVESLQRFSRPVRRRERSSHFQ